MKLARIKNKTPKKTRLAFLSEKRNLSSVCVLKIIFNRPSKKTAKIITEKNESRQIAIH